MHAFAAPSLSEPQSYSNQDMEELAFLLLHAWVQLDICQLRIRMNPDRGRRSKRKALDGQEDQMAAARLSSMVGTRFG